MKVRAKKQFSSTLHGNVVQGQYIEVTPHLYRQMREFDMVEEVEIDQPVKPIAQLASLSQVGQVSQESKSNMRQEKEQMDPAKLSESTQVHLQPNATLSTHVTEDGGKNTSLVSKRGRPAGRKTSGRQEITE